MHNVLSLHVKGPDFLKDPAMSALGVVADVAGVLPLVDARPAEVLQVRLRGSVHGDSKLSVTIKRLDHHKEIVECPVRKEVFPAVEAFFRQQVSARQATIGLDGRLPAVSQAGLLLEVTEDISQRIMQMHGKRGARTAHAAALGDAIGMALLLHEEERACELAKQLGQTLELEANPAPGPARTRVFLNSIAPAMRAAAATDQMGALGAVLAAAVPPQCLFLQATAHGADTGGFSLGIREFLEQCGPGALAVFVEQFAGPNLKLQILNVAIDACQKSGSVAAINACGALVRLLLPGCQGVQSFNSEPGIRVRAFDAAMGASVLQTESLIDDIPRWSRSDDLIGWLTGYVTGLKVRARHKLAPSEAVAQVEHLIYRGNEDNFEALAVEFVRGLLAASQGAQADVSEHILQQLEIRHHGLGSMPRFLSGRFAHQLVVANRQGGEAAVDSVLRDLFLTAKQPELNGDDLMASMCEDLRTDAAIRDAQLREKVAAAIATELRSEENIGRYPAARYTAGGHLYLAGFPKAALRSPPEVVVGETERLVWRIRAADLRSRELRKGMTRQLAEIQESLVSLKTVTLEPEREWGGLIQEAAAVSGFSLAHKALEQAIGQSESWKPAQFAHLTEAVFEGVLRRELALQQK